MNEYEQIKIITESIKILQETKVSIEKSMMENRNDTYKEDLETIKNISNKINTLMELINLEKKIDWSKLGL